MELIALQPEHRTLLENLLELYIYDLSVLNPKAFVLNENGRYGYKYTDLYFTEPQRKGFIFSNNNEYCGFALVNTDCRFPDGEFWMAEFFILKKLQHLGLGTEAAHKIFAQCNGKWEVGVAYTAVNEQEFWRKCVKKYTSNYTEHTTTTEQHWNGIIFRFESIASVATG